MGKDKECSMCNGTGYVTFSPGTPRYRCTKCGGLGKIEQQDGIRTPGPILDTKFKTIVGPCLGNVQGIANLIKDEQIDEV